MDGDIHVYISFPEEHSIVDTAMAYLALAGQGDSHSIYVEARQAKASPGIPMHCEPP